MQTTHLLPSGRPREAIVMRSRFRTDPAPGSGASSAKVIVVPAGAGCVGVGVGRSDQFPHPISARPTLRRANSISKF